MYRKITAVSLALCEQVLMPAPRLLKQQPNSKAMFYLIALKVFGPVNSLVRCSRFFPEFEYIV
jgi:hypothetical protein